jgi:glycine cleavage system H protein
VSELFCPVAGEVVEINARLDGEPALVNTEPYEAGWMIKLRVTDAASVSALLDAAAYTKQLAGK